MAVKDFYSMRKRLTGAAISVFAALALGVPVAAQNQDAWVGTWELNLAKSKYDPANLAPKSVTVKIESVTGGEIKTTTDQVDAQGRQIHLVTIAMFDGKPAEVKGALVPTTRVYKRIDTRTYEQLNFVNDTLTTSQRIITSRDGKTQTVMTTGKDTQGKSINNVSVYDRR
jgi:hypothetical protein